MPKHSGSDGFLISMPGICQEGFLEQRSYPHPEKYYCPHNKRLAVHKNGYWETFMDVESASDDPLAKLTQQSH